jgi:AraC-like DNA-binding protein
MSNLLQPKECGLATRDLEEAREVLTRRYCAHSIFQRDRNALLDVRYSCLPLLNISLNYLQYGAEVDIRPREFSTFFMVHIPLSGQAIIRRGSHELVVRQGVTAVVSPTHAVSTTWTADCKQLMVKIERRTMERLLSHLIYQPINRPLEFPSEIDLTKGLGASFYNLIRHLGEELTHNDALASSSLASTQFEQTLIMMLLTGANHSYREAVEASGKSVCPKHVSRAYEYMVANAHEPITIENLTRVTGVSGRALHEGFKKFKGAPPKACLKAIRMEGVRRELLEARDGDDVTVVAQRWGFFHIGRFASNYQRIFGEKPSQTLRRRR